ncbi:MAG: B12-binding domain-containing radical SAM protein [Nanoarchaeota archaeon]|nr:B12-binding domain-containing radical SAM protein [Nanoarchaeota archaeon]
MNSQKENPTIIGVIPQYPAHTKQNIYGKIRMPPVGIFSVLANINKNSEFDIYVIDENNYKGPVDKNKMPDHVAIQKLKPASIAMLYGGMSNSIPRMFEVAQQYQSLGVTTIAGGSHVDSLPKEALNSGIDIVVHGEGEETAQELLKVILKNGVVVDYKQNLEQILGISFFDEHNNYVFTGKRQPINDLDSLLDPDISIMKFMNKKLSSFPINRGRGCNFTCEFCVVNKQYGRYKAISIEKTFNYFKHMVEDGQKSYFFTDDNFAQNINETIDLCKLIGDYKVKHKKKFDIMVQVRTEIAENPKLLEAMKYAGISSLAIGYESPINEELKAMRKGVTVEKLVKRSRILSDIFHLHGMFIFGYPTFEDSKFKSELTLKQKAKEYARFFGKARIDTIQVFNAVPLPGSDLRYKLEHENRIPPLDVIGWDKYDGLFLCYVPEKGLDVFELQNFPLALMKKRYSGNFFTRNINFGNWINWIYDFSFGLPVNFSMLYTRRFFYNLNQKRKNININIKFLPKRNIFHESWNNACHDIAKGWKKLVIKTYAGGIVRKWDRLYKKGNYIDALKKLSLRKHKS